MRINRTLSRRDFLDGRQGAGPLLVSLAVAFVLVFVRLEPSRLNTGGAHTPHTRAGKTIVIASVHDARNPDFPQVPTFKEMGGNASATALQIVYVPKGVPADAKAKLAAAVTAAAKDPAVIKLFQDNLNMRVVNVRDEALIKYMKTEQKLYTDLIKSYDTVDEKPKK